MSLSPRGSVPDCEYLLDRANAEIDAADRSADDRAQSLHRKLASLYLDRVFGDRPGAGAGSRPSPFDEQRRPARPFMLLRLSPPPELAPAFDDMLAALDGVSGSGVPRSKS